MAQARKRQPGKPAAPASTGWSAALRVLRPDLSGRGLARLAVRSALVCFTVGITATFAHWKTTGFLGRDGLPRLVAMKGDGPVALPAAGPKRASR